MSFPKHITPFAGSLGPLYSFEPGIPSSQMDTELIGSLQVQNALFNQEKETDMKKTLAMFLFLSMSAAISAWSQDGSRPCQSIGGVLMTNINAIPLPGADNGTNLGPVFGDLQGSVAATILGGNMTSGYDVQHYFVTAAGDTIKLKVAHLTPTAAGNTVAVQWGNYISDIEGGTGKFANASGSIEYFGLADFTNMTLVLRYRGKVCHAK